jgi:hypothetical protein
MPTSYQSFLIRLWNLNEPNERFEIEHIQSGQKQVLHSRTAAVEWMRTIDQPFVAIPRKEDTGNQPARMTTSQAVDEARSKEAHS